MFLCFLPLFLFSKVLIQQELWYPQELITHILLESDARGELSPFPKHTEMHLSICFRLCTQTTLLEHERNVSLYREGDYIHEKQRVRILKSC